MDRNGEITGYRIQYGITTLSTTVNITGTSASDRIFTASGLVPLTTYMFRIAAVNSDGVGPYSSVDNFNTTFPTGTVNGTSYSVVPFVLSTDVSLWLNNQLLTNQSIIDLEDIRTGDGRLFCLTNTASCCRSRETPDEVGGVGFWYFPDGTEVPGSSSGFSRDRGKRFVALSRGSSSDVSTGLFKCEIPDVNGVNVTLFAGVYRRDKGNFPYK